MWWLFLIAPIVLGMLFGETESGVLCGLTLGLIAWLVDKGRRQNELVEAAKADKKLRNLQHEIDVLKQRLSVLERAAVVAAESVRNEAAPPVETADTDVAEAAVPPVAEAPVSDSSLPGSFLPQSAFQSEPDNVQTTSYAFIETADSAGRTVPVAAAPVGASETSSMPEAALSEKTSSETETVMAKSTSSEKTSSETKVASKVAVRQDDTPFDFAGMPVAAWFLRGNPLLKAGVVVLFLGLAFLLRFASERIRVPVEMRYLSVAGAGLAALTGGLRLQRRKREYGLVLQGFGVAVMYLTALAALKLHPLLPASVVFGLMVAMIALMAWLAVRQNAQIMAQVAVVGGMAAPLLVSDGSNNYIVLFSYLALLNAGIAAIAWFKAWRGLNLTGFAATFAIAAMWGARNYVPQNFASSEPFLIYHWLLYTFVAYLFARRQLLENREEAAPPVADNATLEEIWHSVRTHGLRVHVFDHTLLFGTMAAAFGLQYRMVAHWQSAAAFSALVFAAVYAAAALMLKRQQGLYILRQAFFALSLVFLTLAVPLYFERGNTVILWAAESALVYYFGLRQQRPHIRLAALLIFLLAALSQLGGYGLGGTTVLQGSWFATLLSLAGGAAVWLMWYVLRREGSAQWERMLQQAVLSAALFYASLLPLLFFANRGSIVALSVLAAAWAFCRRKSGFAAFGAFSLADALFALVLQNWSDLLPDGGQGFLSEPYLFAAAPLLFAAAYWLQPGNDGKARNAVSENQNSGNTPSDDMFSETVARMALLAALLMGFSALQNQWTGEETVFTVLWVLPLYAAVLLPLAKKLNWADLFQTAFAFMPLFALHWMFYSISDEWTFAEALPTAAATALNFLILNNRAATPPARLHKLNIILIGTIWTIWSGSYLGGLVLQGVWAQLAWLAAPLAMWAILYTQRERGFFRRHQDSYLNFAVPLCVLFAACWLVWTNCSTPYRPAPLPYIPLLNPLEIASAGILLYALKTLPDALSDELRRIGTMTTAALALLTVSTGVMRAWHFYSGIEWNIEPLLQSFGLQASLSVVWAVAAIALMVLGNRRRLRPYWMTGAALMAVVVAKLFIIELADSGGIARIASFITVGILLLLVGWHAPIPPAKNDGGNDG